MSNSSARLISVGIPWEDPEDSDFSGTEYYWAVKAPEAVFNDTSGVSPFREGYRIAGSREVLVSDRQDIRGFRELLDQIEADMDERGIE